MGKLYVGNTFIDLLGELKVGTSNVQKVYAGNTLVFPQGSTTTSTTTTCAVGTYFLLTLPQIDCSSACVAGLDLGVESTTLTLGLGTFLYVAGSCLLTPIASGYYSDSLDCYQVDSNGEIIAVSTCAVSTTSTTSTISTTTSTTTEAPTTTTTTTTELLVRIDWDVRETGSGAVQLIIKDNTNTELVNQESQGSGPINGTVYISQSQTPYSVTVSVTAGAEVAQYRICNVTGTTEITLNTNVVTTDTYVVNPTPLHTAVYATYGDTNTPTACPV